MTWPHMRRPQHSLTVYVMSLATALSPLLLIGSCAASPNAPAQETKRFPHSKITPEEWQAFFNEVRAKLGAEDTSRSDRPDVISIAVPSERTIYYFTNGGLAHPAVVIARVTERGRGVYVDHTGYFAGSEAAFARWFGGFSNQVDSLRNSLQRNQ